MKSSILRPTSTRDWLYLLFWIFLIFIAGRYLLTRAFPFLSLNEEVFQRFWGVKWWLFGHVVGGIVALLVGPFQFWKGLRMRNLKLHRNLGKVYVISILVGGLCSTILAWTSAVAIHWTWAISLQSLALVWLLTVIVAFLKIKQKNIASHQRWMVRSYVATFGFVIFRILMDLPVVQAVGNFVETGPTMGWLAWTIPMMIVEPFLQFSKK